MVKRVFLHIGRHKTGTTALQYALDHAPEALGEAGFAYPSASISSDHAYLARWLNPHIKKYASPVEVEDTRRAVEALICDLERINKDVILSSEGLQDVPPDELAQLFSKYDVRIVVFLREQAEYLASAYQQEVKARTPIDKFPEWVLRVLPFRYGGWLAKWISIFGEEKFTIKVYDKELMIDGDIVADFLSVFGIDSAPFKSKNKTDANPSIKGALLEAKRRINYLGYNVDELRRATYGALRNLPNQIAQYRGVLDCDPSVIEMIRARCAEDNRGIAEKYFGRSDLFPLRPFPNEPPPTEEAVETAINLIVEQVRRENPTFADDLVSRLQKAEQLARPA